MSGVLSGRAARRAHRVALRLKGPGYTRPMRKGRTKRKPPEEVSDVPEE